MIIVVEGFDQAGKKTQSKLLAKFLKTRNIKSKIFSFPDYSTPIGKEIRRYLGGKRSFPPQVIHCLLAANRWEKAKEIQDALSENNVVIMNRYYQSNLVYGTVNGLDMKWLENLDDGLPKEDIVILLDVNVSDSFSRKKERRDKFEENMEFAQKIAGTYRKLAKQFGWHIVNASRHKQAVHQDIRQIVLKHVK
ncbi:MAG: dTMP kinase [Thaumarchaeota archaeon]|nr:dTMP kinase [Nitrososphaerota archaeon]MDE1872682.1 dTMP kinase [Nitrososphaerota archaeon]